MESALHRTVEALHQGNRDALQESIVPFSLPKRYFLIQKVFVHQVLLIQRYKIVQIACLPSTAIVGTRYKTLDAVLDRDENRESSSEIMQSIAKEEQESCGNILLDRLLGDFSL